MYKIFAFLRRNTELLSLDEYRAGHVGYHCSHSRRLRGIRRRSPPLGVQKDVSRISKC